MEETEEIRLYIEMWKETIEVQKHFNDIELRIRQLALTVLTFILGGSSLAIRDGTTVRLWGVNFQLASLILFSGAVIWLTFGFVDGIWYHRLLIGAVKHGERLEAEIRTVLPAAGLTKQISDNSPSQFTIRLTRHRKVQLKLRSGKKLLLFYMVVLGILLAAGIVIQIALQTSPSAHAGAPGSATITRLQELAAVSRF